MKRFVTFVIIVGLPLTLLAHNTNVTHPLLTLEAIRLIKKSEDSSSQKQYEELYRTAQSDFLDETYRDITEYPYYWGVWNTPSWTDKGSERLYGTIRDANADEDPGFFSSDEPYQGLFAANPMNVISGVVREDTPFTKVVNHFFHAYTGSRLIVGGFAYLNSTNSRDRALGFLIESANIYAYEAYADPTQFNADEWVNPGAVYNTQTLAKMLAFQSFGEALHHVEDMSSIAHVQNDAHLVFSASELDDYEGLYIPNKIFQLHQDSTPNVQNWFTKTRNDGVPATVSSPLDIWPNPQATMQWNSNSLAHKVYNASVFKGRLDKPGINSFSDNFGATAAGSGELKEMFGDRLQYVRYSILRYPHWRIEGVGDWDYLFGGSSEAWWPATDFGGPANDGNGNEYYYIEQKLGDEYDNSENNLVKVAGGIRKDLLSEYSATNNKLDDVGLPDGGIKLVQKFTDQLLPLAIEYAAGFSQYWYDHVNSPPYLKSVTVRQKGLDAKLPNASDVTEGYQFTAYQARWQNVASVLVAHDNQQAVFTGKRKLKKERLTQPLYNNKEIELILAFSEAIKPPISNSGVYDVSSGFKLELQVLSTNTTTQHEEIAQTIQLNMETLKYVANKSDILEADLKYKLEDPDKIESHMKGSVWKVTVPAAQLEAINNLEGAVRLVVLAEDKNNHRTKDDSGVVQGHELDSTPDTPARVFATTGGDGIIFKWHTKTSFVPSETVLPAYINSKDDKGNSLPLDAFSYDYSTGDNNHILWFSPSVDLDEMILKADKDTDSVSITTLPEKDSTLPR